MPLRKRIITVMITQLAKLHSNYSLSFAAPFSLFLWTNGTSRQVIKALAQCGLCILFTSLCILFTSLFILLNQLASQCIDKAIQISQHPHVFCYDNINISTSIFIEQCSSGPAKVQSGTFPILYTIENASLHNMGLGPMLHHVHCVADLNFNADIHPTKQQHQSIHYQACVNVIHILLQECTSFQDYKFHSAPSLSHKERCRLPKGHKTKQYSLHTSTINESSVSGNIAVINDMYINQLKMTHEQLSDFAIPGINDQSTNACIRGAKVL